MILRRILVSTLSRRDNKLRLFYFQNASFHQPRGSRLITLGTAALALSTAVGLVYLDSDAVRNKESTVGVVYPIFVAVFFAQPYPVEPATSIEFPTTLQIPSKGALPEFTLLGVGVGVVSFLKIKVYSSAFYADLSNPNLKVAVRFEPSLQSVTDIY